MKRFVSIILIVFLLASLTACSYYEGNDYNSNSSSGDERTELILATDGQYSSFSSIINSFNENSENYKIMVVYYVLYRS